MTEETQRIGIVTVSLGLLEQWMQIPPGTNIRDVRSKDGGINGEFEVLVEGQAVPETPAGQLTPYLTCTITVTAPKVEFQLRDRSEAA